MHTRLMGQSDNPAISAGAVILAAGSSTRMGRPKLLLPWAGSTVLGYLISEWEKLGAKQVAVVCATEDKKMQAELDRLGISFTERILNPAPERGMFSSIQIAAAWDSWKPKLTHCAINLGDQPHVHLNTLKAIIDFAASHPRNVCQPRYEGHRRHPVILPWHIFKQLGDSTASDLKVFLSDYSPETSYCDVEDPALAFDMDWPEDYRKALELYNSRK